MRALTIHQPYAQLIAEGAKVIETRNRRTHILNEPILICAGQKILTGASCNYKNLDARLCGHAVCVVQFVACRPFRPVQTFRNNIFRVDSDWGYACMFPHRCEDRYPKWAWELELLYRVKPFPVKGKQGFFNVDDKDIKKLNEENIYNQKASLQVW